MFNTIRDKYLENKPTCRNTSKYEKYDKIWQHSSTRSELYFLEFQRKSSLIAEENLHQTNFIYTWI
jgi:hypothetical protein